MSKFPIAMTLTAALFAAGCGSVSPPKAAMPAALQRLSSALAQSPSVDAGSPPTALQLDAEAETLVQRALAGSPDLERIAARLREMRAMETATNATRWPTLSAQGGAGAANEKNLTMVDGHVKQRLARVDANLGLRWEVDLFGKLAADRRVAAAGRDAAVADLAAARVTLAHSIRSQIVRLRTGAEEARLAQVGLDTLREITALEAHLRAAGLRSDLDRSQLHSSIAAQEASLATLQLEVELAPLRLRTLSDQPIDDIRDLKTDPYVASKCRVVVPQSVATGVPLVWLRQRLDVAAAELRLRAEVAGAEGARAAIYPNFALVASGATQSEHVPRLDVLLSRSIQQFVGIEFVTTLFDAGQRVSASRAAQARADAAAAEFKQTVLLAAEEIEGAMAKLAVAEAASQASLQAQQQAQTAFRLGRLRQQAGIDSRLSVLQLQREALERAWQYTSQERERCLAALELSRALALVEPTLSDAFDLGDGNAQ